MSDADVIDPPLRWGILSTAKIGANWVVPALQGSPHHEVVAVGSRDGDRARTWAHDNGIGRAHGSYEELLADDSVEAVYNPLPNHLHVDWSIAALEAGKHVLCEKPLGLNRIDAQRLVDAAEEHPTLVAMEAFMYRFHPQWVATRDMVTSGRIGELRSIQTFFSYHNVDPGDVRHNPDWGGGALLDIGCYPISQARWLFDAEPVRVMGLLELDPRFRTDRHTSAVLDFGEGRRATWTVATQVQPHQRAQIVGTEGRIEVEIPVNAPRDRATRVLLVNGQDQQSLEFGPADQYAYQADAFARAARSGEPAPTPLADAIANMAVIDAVFASAGTGGWIAVA